MNTDTVMTTSQQASETQPSAEPSLRVGHIELFVADPSASKAFYEDVLGFDVVAIQKDSFVWIQKGDVELLLRPGNGAAPVTNYAYAASAIVLYTNDVPAMARQLQQAGLRFRGTDSSDTCLTFTDPDGHWFQLVNPESH